MKSNLKTEAITRLGFRWLAGNLVLIVLSGMLIYARTQPPSLAGAELHHANLANANLQRVNLAAAMLANCDLGCSNLSGANLRGANLANANLAGTDLRGADLREADLRGTNLENAVLHEADLRSSIYDHNTTWSRGIDPDALGATPAPTVQARTSAAGSARDRIHHTF